MPRLELARDVFVEFLVGNLVELHVPDVCFLVVGCLAAKAKKYTSLASAWMLQELEIPTEYQK